MEIPCTNDKKVNEKRGSSGIFYQSTDSNSVYFIEKKYALESNSEMVNTRPINNLLSHVPGAFGSSNTTKFDGKEHLEIQNVNASNEDEVLLPEIRNMSSSNSETMNEIVTTSASKHENTSIKVMTSIMAGSQANNSFTNLSVSVEHLAAKELEKAKLAPQKCPSHGKSSSSEVTHKQGEDKVLYLSSEAEDGDSDSIRFCEQEKKLISTQFARLPLSCATTEESSSTHSEAYFGVRSVKTGSNDLTCSSGIIPQKWTIDNSLPFVVSTGQEMANFGISPIEKREKVLEKEVRPSKVSEIQDFFISNFYEVNNFAFFSTNNSNLNSSSNLKHSQPIHLPPAAWFLKKASLSRESTDYRGLLNGILRSIPDSPKRESLISRLLLSLSSSLPTSQTYKGSFTPSGSLYWERKLRSETARRRSQKKFKRKWNKQSVANILELMETVGKVMNKKSYYTVFRYNNGRTDPRKELILSLIWTTMFLCLHKEYWDWGTKFLGFTFDPYVSTSFIHYFGIALGFLLCMQAQASSARWWEGRVQWQTIIENSKRLAVLLNTHLQCPRLSRYGTRLILANLICVRNCMQDKYDVVWEEELLKVLDWKTVDKMMNQPRRLRSLSVLYGFQRIIYVSIDHKLLPSDVTRDINPTIVTISNSHGACNRIRITKLPWIIAVHLQFMLFVFIGVLPISLVEAQKHGKWEFVAITKISWVDVYIYVICVAYAFFGLSRMALDIDNPFSFTRENHSFGFWGFYEYWSTVEMDNLRSIIGFHVKRQGMLVSTDGVYGNTWTTKKLEIPIEKLINSNLPRTHNLFGRTDDVRMYLQENKRSNSFSNLLLQDDDSTSFTFESTSGNESEEFVTQQTSVDKSMFHDGVYGNNNNVKEVLKRHTVYSSCSRNMENALSYFNLSRNIMSKH